MGVFHGKTSRNVEDMSASKIAMPIEDLCEDLPDEFACALRIVRALGVNDEPNYTLLAEMFWNLAKRMGIATPGFEFTWITNQKKYVETSRALKELLAGAPFPKLSATQMDMLSKAREQGRGHLAIALRNLRALNC